MRIVVLVESLTFGGAERQACVLAGEFKRRGHEVLVATYHQDDFYRPLLEHENVEHRFLGGNGKVSWAANVRRFLRTHGQDVVLAFLPGPSAYAELAGLPRRSWGLVISERSARIRSRAKAKLHTLADYVVVNSHAARVANGQDHPRLRAKLITIYNAVRLHYAQTGASPSTNPSVIRLVVAASVDRNKNTLGLLAAMSIVREQRPTLPVRVDWYGSQGVEPELLPEIRKAVSDRGLDSVFHVYPATERIHDVISQADAVLLPSFHEGLPNAVCEGMMLGKPILMSDVSDARNLVQDGVNGFLFNPQSSESIADAVAKFAGLVFEARVSMGRASRARAEVLFDMDTVAERYLHILEAASAREVIKIEHWPEEVPGTACSWGG